MLSPTASASTPLDFSAAGGCNAASSEREADRFQFRRRQDIFQRARCARWEFPRAKYVVCPPPADSANCQLQRRNVGWKTALGLQLQQARGVGFRQRRQFRVRRQHPFQRHAEDAMALAHAGGVELVADFTADEFRRGGQRIERERDGKCSAGIAASRSCAAAPRRRAGCRPAPDRARWSVSPFPKIDFQNVVHCVVLRQQSLPALSPSAQPSRLKSWR